MVYQNIEQEYEAEINQIKKEELFSTVLERRSMYALGIFLPLSLVSIALTIVNVYVWPFLVLVIVASAISGFLFYVGHSVPYNIRLMQKACYEDIARVTEAYGNLCALYNLAKIASEIRYPTEDEVAIINIYNDTYQNVLQVLNSDDKWKLFTGDIREIHWRMLEPIPQRTEN